MKRDKNESSTNNIVAIVAVVVLLIGIVATLVLVSPSGEGALEPIEPAAPVESAAPALVE